MMREQVINYFALKLSGKVSFSTPMLQRAQASIISLRGDKRKLTGSNMSLVICPASPGGLHYNTTTTQNIVCRSPAQPAWASISSSVLKRKKTFFALHY